MTWNEKTTCNDYIEALEDLIHVVTSRHMATVVRVAQGANYAVGDILAIDNTSSTRFFDAQIEVTAVSSGLITDQRIYRGGAYTVDPPNISPSTTTAVTGVGTGATFTLTFAATGWTVLSRRRVAASAVQNPGGAAYTVGDDVTLVGGQLWSAGVAAVFNVDTIDGGGAITGLSLVTAGDYEVIPANPITVTGGTGNSALLDVTWTDSVGVENAVVLQGNAGAETDPIVGIFTYSDRTDATGGPTVRNWAIFSMTAWSDQFSMYEQANISPGFELSPPGLTVDLVNGGAFVPLKASDAFDIEWAISATSRRVFISFKVESNIPTVFEAHCSFGLFNPFGVPAELPYPAYVAGATDRPNAYYADTAPEWGGLVQVLSRSLNGPFFAWTTEGQWASLAAGFLSSDINPGITYGQGQLNDRAWLWPIGAGAQIFDDDQIWILSSGTNSFNTDQIVLAANPTQIYPTPGTGGTSPPLYPVIGGQTKTSAPVQYRLFGEVDGVFWFSLADTGLTSRDRIIFGNTRYKVFQNGTRADVWSYIAVRED